MQSTKTSSADSVLDEIRSTIASFESLRTSGFPHSDTAASAAPTSPNPYAALVGSSSAVSTGFVTPAVATPAPSAPSTPASAAPASAIKKSRDTEHEPKSIVPSFDDDDAELPRRVKTQTQEPSVRQRNASSFVTTRTVDKSARIMIVDDEPLNVMTFRQHLKMEGYEHFVTTSDAREALHLLRSEKPDVLLLDIRMPEISGLDILRVIGLDPVLQHAPVLILTAASDPATRKQA